MRTRNLPQRWIPAAKETSVEEALALSAGEGILLLGMLRESITREVARASGGC